MVFSTSISTLACVLASVAAVRDGQPPVISLDLTNDEQCAHFEGCTKIFTRSASSWRTTATFQQDSFKQEAAVCHQREEWNLLLHGGEPGFVDQQCVTGSGAQTETFAKRCNVLTATAITCPEPKAHVFDHHEGNVDDKLQVQRKVFVESLPHQTPTKANRIVDSINYNLRCEYLLAFDATDSSGNKAETVQFAMIMQDEVDPVLTLTAHGHVQSVPAEVESIAGFERYAALPIPQAHDNYDADVTDTITVSVDDGHGPQISVNNQLDTLLLGEKTLTIKFHDFASIFGKDNINNEVVHTYKIQVKDSTPPQVLCRTGGPVHCHLEQVAGQGDPQVVCTGAVPCVSADAEGQHECKRDYKDDGAICIDAHDSSVFAAGVQLAVGTLPALDTDVIEAHAVHNIDADSSVWQSEHPVNYTCTDGANNTATGTRTVFVKDRTPPNLDVTDDTGTNLNMNLICGDTTNNAAKLKELRQLGNGYTATDDCTTAACTVTLHYGNCAGEFTTHEGTHVFGGGSPAIANMTAAFDHGVAVYHKEQSTHWQQENIAAEGTADNKNTLEIEGGVYGMKYSCKDDNDNVVSKCRTIVNEESNICNPAPIACEVTDWQPWAHCSHSCGAGSQTRIRSVSVPSQFGGNGCPELAQTRACNVFECPIDCEVGQYGAYGDCTLTCGGGLKTRFRTVTQPSYGGKSCPHSSNKAVCNEQECPVDCVFEWQLWTTCTMSCGSGLQEREPSITVYHNHGGVECPGLERRSCNIHACPVDCEIGTWSAWGRCDKTCGGGSQERTRIIMQPINGGRLCPVSYEQQPCNDADCPIDCVMGTWGAWGACDKSCKDGSQSRHRSITTAVAFGGKACPSQDATQTCNTHYCPIDCYVGTWTAWSNCDQSCDTGTQTSTRVLQPPDFGGKLCPASSRAQQCNTNTCPKNCVVSSWAAWGACTDTCGTGSQTRSRTMTSLQEHGGAVCPSLNQVQDCNTQCCPVDCIWKWMDWQGCSVTCDTGINTRRKQILRETGCGGAVCPAEHNMDETMACAGEAGLCPIHCEVNQWQAWSICTQSCGEGFQKRARTVKVHAAHGGYVCPDLRENRFCNKHACPKDCEVGTWQPWGRCSRSCGKGNQMRHRRLVRPESGGRLCPAANVTQECNRHACPVDCVVSAWTMWDDCTKTCDTGKTERTRTIEVNHAHGGVKCPPTLQMSSCHDRHCPVHCEVGQWTSWSGCPATCGGGKQARTRDIVTHDAHGGYICPGTEDEKECAMNACPVDCAVGAWSAWSTCDVDCGGGLQSRDRTVLTQPAKGGIGCPSTHEQLDCNTHLCPIHCEVSNWTEYGPCSKSCGTGQETKTRDIITEAVRGGEACGDTSHTQRCNTEPCPVDCQVGDWEQWSHCDLTCGSGTQIRSRTSTPAMHGGTACPHSYESQDCNTNKCPKNCFVTTWSAWSACTKSCGTGVRSRTRAAVQPEHGGQECPTTSETEGCNAHHCPVNCQMSVWTAYSACTVTCGGGTKDRFRSVTIPTLFGGKSCPASKGTATCNMEDCPIEPVHCLIGMWTEWGPCTKSCGSGVQGRTRVNAAPQHGGDKCPTSSNNQTCNTFACPVNCEVGTWDAWTDCTHSCGTEGKTARHRSINVDHANGGTTCEDLDETNDCNVEPCPSDCEIGAWTAWGACSVSCGGGTATRTRPMRPPANGGVACLETEFTHTEQCNQHACPLDCVTGNWGAWDDCSTTCGSGQRKRERSLTGGLGGAPCPAAFEFETCSLTVCPVDCQMREWTEFSICTESCGGGSQSRTRETVVEAAFGGSVCGAASQSQSCNMGNCPVDCVVGEWSDWTECTKTCDSGTRSRTRTLTPPEHGGAPCAAVFTGAEACNTQTCPADCGLGEWQAWSQCTTSCGGGTQQRQRVLTGALAGGVSCIGFSATEIQDCNSEPCPIDCQVGTWTVFQPCSRSCSSGVQTRTRSVDVEALHGGRGCPSLSQTTSCNSHPCPTDCKIDAWSDWSTCTHSCTHENTPHNYGTQHRERVVHGPSGGGAVCPATTETQSCGHILCPIHCQMSVWSSWSACSKSCGTGSQTRTRTVLSEARHSGDDCPGQQHQQQCNQHDCPSDCSLSAWSPWSMCTVSCGSAQRSRIRTVISAAYGGMACASTKESEPCNDHPCPKDCGVGEWSPFDDCSVSCGAGSKTRTRLLSDPEFGGTVCPGPSEVISCSWGSCPVGCQVGTWTDWSDCTKSCATGSQTRTREIQTRNDHGGVVCPELEDTRACGTITCPIDCEIGEWTAWTPCTKTCGSGSTQRSRTVTAPRFAGLGCPVSEQITPCAELDCPIDCDVGQWAQWTTCSEQCGPGTYTRSRSISIHPDNGGEACPELVELENCNLKPCPVDCVHTWEDWSECTVSCGAGVQSRSLNIEVEAEHGGAECPVAQDRLCNTDACPTPTPTPAPTNGPTSQPTPAPTPLPTTAPTHRPKPIIDIIDGSIITIEATTGSDEYVDAGAWCSDLHDGQINDNVEVSGDIIDMHKPSHVPKYVDYACSASDGETAYARRTVYVADTTCPTCHINGPAHTTIEASFPYRDEGATCMDSVQGTLPSEYHSDLDVEAVGTYIVTYVATDQFGNSNIGMTCSAGQQPVQHQQCCRGGSHTVRTVTVVDTLKPVIGLKYRGNSYITTASPFDTSDITGEQNPAHEYFKTSLMATSVANRPWTIAAACVAAAALAQMVWSHRTRSENAQIDQLV